MKANDNNYFKNGKLYQWDKEMNLFSITNTDIEEEFALDKKGMESFLKFDNPTITIDGALKVKSGKTKGKILLNNIPLPNVNLNFENEFEIDTNVLKVANRFVRLDDKKPILKGVYVGPGYIVATDALRVYKCPSECNANITIAKEFANELANQNGVVKVKCDKRRIAFANDTTMVIGRLMEGTYPSVDSFYGMNYPNVFTMDKSTLQYFLKFSTDKTDLITFSKNLIQLKSLNSFESDEEINYEGKLTLPVDNLKIVIESIEEDTITFEVLEKSTLVKINEKFILVGKVSE